MSRRWLAALGLALALTAVLAPLVGATHAAPTGVTVTAGASELTVDWTASTGAVGYKVQWKSGTQNWDPNNRETTVSDGTTETATITSLTPTTVYTVRVGATKGTENPAWSDTATGAPLFGCKDNTAVGSVQPVTGANNDLIDDCENLLAAKDELRGTASLNWATTTAMGSWNGLILHSDRVLSVALPNKSLTGRIPSELGNLTFARFLNLTANSLTGGIPAALSGMTNLKTLSLNGNSLSGSIPPALGNLANLTGLHLQDNQLTGTIPASEDGQGNPTGLAKFAQLQTLSLGANSLTGQIPAALGHVSTLKSLSLDENSLTGSIPAGTDDQNNPTGLARLTNLETLQLRLNGLTGSIPAGLGRLTKLTYLSLRDNDLSGSIPTALGNLTKLQYVYLHRNQLSGNIPAALAGLTELKTLWLQDNKLTGSIPTALGNLANLTDLSLEKNRLSGGIPAALGNLTKLQYLYLYGNQLTGPIPAGTDNNNDATGLAKLTSLRHLYLNCNDLTGTVPAELGDITTLQRLGINGNPDLDQDLTALNARRSQQTTPLSAVQTPTVTCPAVTAPATAPAQAPTPTPAPARAPAPQPKLAASLSAAPDPVTVGQTITYTLTVTNTGQVPLTGLFWRSPELGVGRGDIGDGTLAVDAAVEATFGFGPVTAEHLPGPIVVNVFADSDQTDDVRAALGVAVQPAPAPAPIPTPTPGPRPGVSTLDLTVARAGYSAPDPPEPHLGHNILDLSLTFTDGDPVACDFLTYYEATGGLTRWGYAISEIIEERLGALTQYYQRGAVDCHFRAGRWRVERRLTWDFLGGGLRGAPDLGVEPHLLSDQPGEVVGPWGHRVSNFAVDGTFTGFLDFFEALGGVRAFGYPKTEARRDDHPEAVLRLPGATPGFIRQYFQAAVFEYHPDDADAPVKLGLAGDLLRDLLYPDEAYLAFRSFRPVPPLEPGQPYQAERVIWRDGG